PGVEVVARRQWPSGMASLGVELSGRIPAGEQAEPGRALGRLDSLGWGAVLRELFAAPDDPGELPTALRKPVVAALDAWAPAVTGVRVVGSVTRPGLVSHRAGGVARHLGVPVLARVLVTGAPARHDVNSAQRLAGVARRLDLEVAPGAVLDGSGVLLVDDRTDSGWTLTVAARLLRRAGAGAVHPFVLGVG